MTIPPQSVAVVVHDWRIDSRNALTAAALCWAGFALTVWLVESGRSVGFDARGLAIWHGLRPDSPLLLESIRDVTALGGVLLRNLFALGAVVALLFIRFRREAIMLVLTVAGAWIVEFAIKSAVGRERPEVTHLAIANGASFPSGHSFNAAAVYIAIALAFATLSARQSVRLTVIGTALAASVAIAWTRVWLGVHHPTDVIAGWLGGAGWAFTAAGLLQRAAEGIAEQSARPVKRFSPIFSDRSPAEEED